MDPVLHIESVEGTNVDELRIGVASWDESVCGALGDDGDVGRLCELVNEVATRTERQRFGGAHDDEISFGNARSEQHDRERVVVLSRPPTKAVGSARRVWRATDQRTVSAYSDASHSISSPWVTWTRRSPVPWRATRLRSRMGATSLQTQRSTSLLRIRRFGPRTGTS